MPTKKPHHAPTERAQQTHRNVLANFKRQGISFNAFCEQNNIHRGNASKALLGIWHSKKAKALRSQLIAASRVKIITNTNTTTN